MDLRCKYSYILNDAKYSRLKDYCAHGSISVYEHSLNVANACKNICNKFNIKCDIDELIIAALLHDYYLYDWHKASKEVGLHGFTHSHIAAENSNTDFSISRNTYINIESHMWPLNITKIPKTKEGWILCLADKYCAIWETFLNKKCL